MLQPDEGPKNPVSSNPADKKEEELKPKMIQ
jgi:hypothetical protein